MKSILDLYELRSKDLNYTATTTIDNTTDTTLTDTDTEGPSLLGSSLRGRKGWGDRSVNHLLAAIDQARLLDDYRCNNFTFIFSNLCVQKFFIPSI